MWKRRSARSWVLLGTFFPRVRLVHAQDGFEVTCKELGWERRPLPSAELAFAQRAVEGLVLERVIDAVVLMSRAFGRYEGHEIIVNGIDEGYALTTRSGLRRRHPPLDGGLDLEVCRTPYGQTTRETFLVPLDGPNARRLALLLLRQGMFL